MLSTFYQKLNWISWGLVTLSLFIFLGSGFVLAEEELEEYSECSKYDEYYDCDTLAIFEDAGISDTNMGFDDLFPGSTAKAPKIKNPYMLIYKMMKQDPADTALKKVAEEYQYTQSDMKAILSGDLALLAQTNETLDTQDTLDLLLEIKEAYADAYQDEQIKQEMLLDSYPKEFFVNGDTSDSGFDVLNDLLIIELILFGENKPISTATGGINSGDGDEVDLADVELMDADAGDGGGGVSPGDGEDGTDVDAEVADEEVPTEDEEEEFNPAECVADDALQTAFGGLADSVDETEDADAEAEGEEAGDGEGDSGGGGGTGGGGGDLGDAFLDYGLTAAESNEWETPDFCGDIFCLVIRVAQQEDVQYLETDNCIQCHVQYIVKALQDTTDKTLNPGKISGNLMEPAMCKRSLLSGGINLNFIPIAMPIQTPPASDIIKNVNIGTSWREFIEDVTNKEAPEIDTTGSGEPDLEWLEKYGDWLENYIENKSEKAAKYVKTIASETTPATEMSQNATLNYEEELARIEQVFTDSRMAARFSGAADFYEAVGYEMDQMQYYFQSFQQLIGLTQIVAKDLNDNLQKIR